jgi:hypothetical protein
MAFQSDGDVGIGTTSPLSKLDVYGEVTLSGANRFLNIIGDINTSVGGVKITTPIYGNDTGVDLEAAGANGQRLVFTNDFAFKGGATKTAAATATPFMIIKSMSGNIGVGTATPSYGFVSTAATSSFRNIIPETTLTYDLGASSTRFNNAWINTLNLGSSTWSLTQTNGRLAIFDQPGATGTERLTIATNGNIGFGSSSPSSAFSVAGTATFGSGITAASFTGSATGLTGTAASLTAGTASALSSMNISQFSNNSGYITDGNTNWDNAYGYITSGNTGWSNVYGFVTDPGGITRTGICHADAVFTNGFYTGGSSNGAGACADGDIAENYGTDDHVERGDIVILSEENTVSREYNITNPSEGESTSTKYTITTANVKKATIEKRSRIIGAIPTSPYMIGTEDKIATSSNPEPVALVGHVPIKMTLDGGDIAIGDPITISNSAPGKGMKAVTSGRIVGYALEAYTATSTSIDNMIEVYIKPDDYVVPDEQLVLTNLTSHINAFSSDVVNLKGGLVLSGALGVGVDHPLVMLHIKGNGQESIGRFEGVDGYCDITATGLICTTNDDAREQVHLLDSTSTTSFSTTTSPLVATSASSTLEKLTALHVITYTLASSTASTTALVTEEIQTLFPGLTSLDSATGKTTFSLTSLIPYIIESIKSLSVKIDTLVKEFSDMKLDVTTEKVTSKTICLGDTCIDEVQLKKLLEASTASVSAEQPGPTEPSNGSSTDATSTPPDNGTTTDATSTNP